METGLNLAARSDFRASASSKYSPFRNIINLHIRKRSKNTPALTGPVKNKLVPLKQAPERPPPTSQKPTLSPDDKPLPTNPQKGF